MMSDRKLWESAGCGKYPVTVIPCHFIHLKDGTKISLKIWYPARNLKGTDFCYKEHYTDWDPDAREDIQTPVEVPVPALLEYLPYRHTDFMLPNDYRHHTWLCSHGYVNVRADIRGTGCSDGLYYGEYLQPEQSDCVEIIDWLAAQIWCNGNVGMSGHSWGGFNSLQVAYLQPPALKAIITTYSTDDRYASDIHTMGGAFLGTDSLTWSNRMFLWNLAPPNPQSVPDWKKQWLTRLDKASSPWIRDWLKHPSRDAFWEHGSVIEDKSRIKIPVLAVGGFQDGYKDAVFRMASYLPENFRCIVGPWSHALPDYGLPGPGIHYNAECLKWWDYHLKGIHNEVVSAPRMRLYLQEGLPPQPSYPMRPGSWVAEETWPPQGKDRYITYALDNTSNTLIHVHPNRELEPLYDCCKVVKYDGRAGLGSMKWYTYGAPNELPDDQRETDKYSLCWYSDVLDHDLAILGQPNLTCTVSVENSDRGILIARLCDIFPDGSSTLLSCGVLNLNHQNGHAPSDLINLEPHKEYTVDVEFMATSCILAKGHRLSLGISSSHWPLVWPSKDPVDIKVHSGICPDNKDFYSKLVLPVRPTKPVDMRIGFDPAPSYPSPVTVLDDGSFIRTLQEPKDLGQNYSFNIAEDSGRKLIKPTNTIIFKRTFDKHEINETDPLSARATVTSTLNLEWPEGSTASGDHPIRTKMTTRSEMWADKDRFHTHHQAQVKLDGEEIFTRTWDDAFPRFFC